MNPNWLLVFVPIGIGLDWFGANASLVFATSALAIVPLAALMGDATEALARFLGPTIGGLLNATLGNAPEIIISSFALRAGLVDIVKASLAGSILGNLLLGLGLSFLAGGIKLRRNQRFDTDAARTATALLTLATFGMIIPAVTQFNVSVSRTISRECAVILFVVYLASLAAIFWNRKPLIGKEGVKADLKERERRPDEVRDEPEPGWSRNKALAVLAAVAIVLAIMSEVLTGSVRPAAAGLHLTPRFAGMFLLATVGNAAELFNAVRFARKDQMDLAIGVTVGASTQVGLLVAPVLVFVGMLMGQNMDLIFSPLELIAIVMAVYVARNLIYDGESSWLEGLILVAVYCMFGIGFLHRPETDRADPPLVPATARP
ncbi:MAG: calcium/proton exchanger [Isosphaeraceae bacterium]|nr:calcium/proton exchanger [Isosphaeraceae bacterium]